ncbi:MAG: tetratricopeptide repeat protein, partial [Gammaproteobacteria bacterium]
RLWLARVYLSTGQFPQAVQTFAALEALAPNNPTVLIQYADALAMSAGGTLDRKATELIERALVLEPDNVTALWLAGIATDQAGDPQRALDYLQRAKSLAAASEIPTDDLDSLIAEVSSRDGSVSASAAQPGRRSDFSRESMPRISVTVRLDPALPADLPAMTPVFVIARAPGSPLPLAVKRINLADLPADVVLDDSLAMSPAYPLSSAPEVNVVARISRSGNAIAASGDLEGTAGPVEVGPRSAATVVIKRVVP